MSFLFAAANKALSLDVVGGEGWVRGRFSEKRNAMQLRSAAPSPRALPPDCAGERGSDRRALRARPAHLIGAAA